MKILLQFKNPDYMVAVDGEWQEGYGSNGVPKKHRATIEKYVEFDEYIQVEYDTETKTWRVVPVQ